MARGYSPVSRKKNRTGALLIVTLLVIVALAANAISHGALAGRVRAVGAFAGMTVGTMYDAVAHNGFFSTRSSLEQQNQLLAERVAELQDQLAGTSQIRAENQQLQGLTHVAQTEPGFAVSVLSSFHSSPYGTFLISTQGQQVAPNDLVEDDGGFVIGKVVLVDAGTALVSEIFAPNASIDAIVDGIEASADGQGGGNARMEVPQSQSANVLVGDAVDAPSLDGRPVGVVGHVSSDPSNAYATIYISLPTNIESLGYVYVVKQ